MNLSEFTEKHPVLVSIVIVAIVIVISELPIPMIRSMIAPLTGRFYGDYLTDFAVQAVIVVALILAAPKFGLKGRLGFSRPRSWSSLVLVWPLIVMSFLNALEVLSGEVRVEFDPILLVIFVCLYLSVGLIEEVLFRGYVQGLLIRRWGYTYRGVLVAVLLSTLIFSGSHLGNLAMGRSTVLYTAGQIIYAFYFGVFFSALYIRTGSIVPGIGLHMLFDFMGNLDAFAPGSVPRSEIVRTTTPQGFLFGTLLLLPLLLIGFIYLRKSKVSPLLIQQ